MTWKHDLHKYWYWLKSSSILKFPHRSDLPVFAKPHSYAEPTIYEWRGVKEGFFDGGRAVMALRYSAGSSSNITHYVQGRQRGRYSHKYHLAFIPVIWAQGTISYNSLILFPLCHPSDANFAIPSSNENETFSFYWPASRDRKPQVFFFELISEESIWDFQVRVERTSQPTLSCPRLYWKTWLERSTAAVLTSRSSNIWQLCNSSMIFRFVS